MSLIMQVVRGLEVRNFSLALCLKNLWFISMKKLATLGYVVDVYLSRKFRLISKNFKLISQRKQNPFLVRPVTTGRVVGGVALESEE